MPSTGEDRGGPAGLAVRRLEPAEWETLRDLRLQALADSPAAFASTLERELGFDEATWRSRFETSVQLVALDDGVPVGMVSVFRAPEGEPHLVAMWVAPAARRRGAGALLVRAAASEAAALGAGGLRLYVADHNLGAEALYRREGFEPTGASQALPGRPELGEHEMRLALPVPGTGAERV